MDEAKAFVETEELVDADAIMQEFDRVPDEYKLKLGSGGPAKTRAKYLKAQENKKKQ